MKSVLLRLEGPLQSWGTQGRFGIRDTDREPSKSGVLGLVGAALGMARNDDGMLTRLRGLRMAIRVDREGGILRDYQTAGGGSFLGKPHGVWVPDSKKGVTALTDRFYLTDASFLVALGGSDAELVGRIAAALKAPVWPLFLGRRACVPSRQVFEGEMDVPPDTAVVKIPWSPRAGELAPEQLRLVLETEPGLGQPRQDEPESFTLYKRRHGLRHVRTSQVAVQSLPEAP